MWMWPTPKTWILNHIKQPYIYWQHTPISLYPHICFHILILRPIINKFYLFYFYNTKVKVHSQSKHRLKQKIDPPPLLFFPLHFWSNKHTTFLFCFSNIFPQISWKSFKKLLPGISPYIPNVFLFYMNFMKLNLCFVYFFVKVIIVNNINLNLTLAYNYALQFRVCINRHNRPRTSCKIKQLILYSLLYTLKVKKRSQSLSWGSWVCISLRQIKNTATQSTN